MSRSKKLVFGLDALSDAGRAYLRQGWCVDEDPNHLQVSEWSLLDNIYDSGEGEELDSVPESLWETLGLSAEDRAEIAELWAENADNEVEFE